MFCVHVSRVFGSCLCYLHEMAVISCVELQLCFVLYSMMKTNSNISCFFVLYIFKWCLIFNYVLTWFLFTSLIVCMGLLLKQTVGFFLGVFMIISGYLCLSIWSIILPSNFYICASVHSSRWWPFVLQGKSSKRVGALYVTCQLFKIYFKVIPACA